MTQVQRVCPTNQTFFVVLFWLCLIEFDASLGPLAFLNSKSPRIVCHQSTDSTPFVLILTQRAPVFAAGEHALYASMQ